jgi:hypothetical protein
MLPPGQPPKTTQALPEVEPPYTLSSWIRGDKYGCCSPVGDNGPIETELYFDIGPSIPFGNGQVAKFLQTGLDMGFGGRVLFFDAAMDSAWVVDIGLTNITNHAHNGTPMAVNILVPQNPNNPVTPPSANGTFPPVHVFFGRDGAPGVTLQELNRTYVNLGAGKDWYLIGDANSCGSKFRFGIEGGGRYGTERAEFHEIPHRTDVIAGLYCGVHADYECPLCGCFVFVAGFRFEYGYTWSDIMQIQNDSDVQDVNLLFNIGVRF